MTPSPGVVTVSSRTVAMDERRKAVIGTGVVFGIAALVGCSSAMTGGNTGGADGASAAPEIVTTTTIVAPTTTEATDHDDRPRDHDDDVDHHDDDGCAPTTTEPASRSPRSQPAGRAAAGDRPEQRRRSGTCAGSA